MDRKKQAQEISLIWISTFLTIIFATGNIVVSAMCDSMTILLDGLYGMADAVISIMMIFVVRKLHQPPNSRYNYGYAKYEPVMIFLEGIMFATICVTAIGMGIQDLIHQDSVKNIKIAVLYSLVAGAACVGFGAYMKVSARKLSSPIVEANAELSIAEGLISLGVCAAFTVAQVAPKTSWMSRTEIIDPAMCIAISLLLMYKPLQIIYESFSDLIDASLDERKQSEIKYLLHRCKDKYSLKDIGDIKVRKAGRRLFLTISFVADHNRTLRELEAVREGVTAEMVKVHPGADVCIVFCAKRPAGGADAQGAV